MWLFPPLPVYCHSWVSGPDAPLPGVPLTDRWPRDLVWGIAGPPATWIVGSVAESSAGVAPGGKGGLIGTRSIVSGSERER